MSMYAFVLLLILIIAFVLSFTTITKYKYFYVIIITVLLSVLAFFFNPVAALENGNYTDLYRFFKTLDAIKGLPFDNSIPIFQEYNNIPVMKVVLFLISRVQINQLLPFMACLIFYGLTGVFIVKISMIYEISSKMVSLAFLIFVCVFNYKMVITNIRCPIGEVIFILTLYYDILKKPKSKLYLLGYLICWGIHPIFLLFTVLRVLLLLMNKVTDKILYIIVLVYALFIASFIELINSFSSIEFFGYISMKLDYYVNSWNTESNEWLLVMTAVLQSVVLDFFIIILRKKIEKNSVEEKFYKLTIIFTLFSIGSYWNFVVFQRVTWFLLFLILYWYIYMKGLGTKKRRYVVQLSDLAILLLVVLSLISYFFTYQYNVLTF